MYYLARNPDTNKEVLKTLSNYKNYWVKWCVFLNFNAPKEITEKLYKEMGEDEIHKHFLVEKE